MDWKNIVRGSCLICDFKIKPHKKRKVSTTIKRALKHSNQKHHGVCLFDHLESLVLTIPGDVK